MTEDQRARAEKWLAEFCFPGTGGTAQHRDSLTSLLESVASAARRDLANSAGAMARDQAAALERSAVEHEREEDSEEADLLRRTAHDLSKLSGKLYALGSLPQ